MQENQTAIRVHLLRGTIAHTTRPYLCQIHFVSCLWGHSLPSLPRALGCAFFPDPRVAASAAGTVMVGPTAHVDVNDVVSSGLTLVARPARAGQLVTL